MTAVYAPERVALIDCTLREGEQFATAHFSSAQRIALARLLDAFGVEYLELTSPASSPQSAADIGTIANLGLRARVLTHIRCHLADARLALESGAHGVNMLFATSEALRVASHGHTLDQIVETARQVIGYLREHKLEIRFSCEDAFRTPLEDLLRVYVPLSRLGIQRIGVADTVGIATPRQVYDTIRSLRAAVACDIEFHGHDDSGCAVANAFCALEAGATHVDVSILGIGERNGIASLSGFVARLVTTYPALTRKYRLQMLPQIDQTLAQMIGQAIPFNMPITGATAFTHKAGLHTKAVLNDPRSYEALEPALFGRQRTLALAHRLTGWHAVAERGRELGIRLGEPQARAAATRLKTLADQRAVDMEDMDALLYEYAE